MMAIDRNERGHILIAGPPYRGYLGMIAHAFEESGFRTSVLEWKYPKRNVLQECLFYASSAYRSKLAAAQDVLNAAAIEKAVEDLRPDSVLVMKNAALSKKTKKLCDARGTKLALWAYDNVRQYPQIAKTAADYDLTFTYEPDDVKLLAQAGSAKYLPMAYDPRFYFPAPEERRKDIDICFVGDLRDTPVRKNTLRLVAHELPDSTVGVWTDTVHWYSHRRLKDLRFTMRRAESSPTESNRTRTTCARHHPTVPKRRSEIAPASGKNQRRPAADSMRRGGNRPDRADPWGDFLAGDRTSPSHRVTPPPSRFAAL